jgi:hypothetical protein|tara:strand:+ start:210 stop:401 length:192 start_codon:yes stop_codon:yes gene_type:complete
MKKKEIYIYNILNKIRGPYLMESGLVELTSKGLMQCNNDTLKNLLFLIDNTIKGKEYSNASNK